MPNTLPNVNLPANTWVNLYTSSGISVGTQLTITNVGSFDVRLVVVASSPEDVDGYDLIPKYGYLSNTSGDSGAWAICIGGDGLVNVKGA